MLYVEDVCDYANRITDNVFTGPIAREIKKRLTDQYVMLVAVSKLNNQRVRVYTRQRRDYLIYDVELTKSASQRASDWESEVKYDADLLRCVARKHAIPCVYRLPVKFDRRHTNFFVGC